MKIVKINPYGFENEKGEKRRISGTGGFPAPTEKDLGREFIKTRSCITWNGVLGHFTTYAVADNELGE